MKLLARYAQRGDIERRQIGLACQIGIVHKAPQRLDCTVQGLAQLLQHPRQRPQILFARASFCVRCVDSINR